MNSDKKTITIAIDGPASAGKSTIAKNIAAKLGIIYIDTGAMYRAAALKAIRLGINTDDRKMVCQMLPNTSISICFVNGVQRVLLDGEDVSDLIRTQEVSNGASKISAVPECRIKLVELQRKLAEQTSVVMDGRDIGTNVLPNADFKFYITAKQEERAKRRYLELERSNRLNGMTFDELLKETVERDERDSNRDFVPLKQADDAILIDTTDMNAIEATSAVINCIER